MVAARGQSPFLGGAVPIWTTSNRPYDEVSMGTISDQSIVRAMGERESMGITAAGEDIWRGAATSIPTPPDVGEQMTVVSSDVADDAAGTGVQTLRIDYIDAAGDRQSEDIIMDGTTEVDTGATDIRFVNDMHSLTVGTNGVAEGDIIIYQKGTAATIYNMIALGGNKSLVPQHMVPRAKTLILKGWHASEAQNKRVNVRIRSTDVDGVLIPGVFCFKGTTYLNQTTSGELNLNIAVPEFSIVKISGWPDALGAEVGCGWWGLLVDNDE